MKYLRSEAISPHRSIDNSGYLICTDAILSRTGTQEYAKAEIFADSNDYDTKIKVDRPYNEVMDQKSLASFENKPVVVEHPDEDVNPENCKDYSVGFVRDVHQGKTDDGIDVMLGTLVITDKDAIEQIQKGDYKFLSCGYDCEFVEDGADMKQTHIRGNHVALCKIPRAGITRIQDSAQVEQSDANDTLVLDEYSMFVKFDTAKDAFYAKKYLDRYDVYAVIKSDTELVIPHETIQVQKSLKSVLESDFAAKCDEPKQSSVAHDSLYGDPVERNTVTIRRGYHNLSAAAEKFNDIYKFAMKETSSMNIRMVINALETMYIDAYNDSLQAYQQDMADVTTDSYIRAIQLANDFKIKRRSRLTKEQSDKIDDYVKNINALVKRISDNAVPSTFKKDLLQSLNKYDDATPAVQSEHPISFNGQSVIEQPVKPEDKHEDNHDVKSNDSNDSALDHANTASNDSSDDEYVVLADNPNEAIALLKFVREHEKK